MALRRASALSKALTTLTSREREGWLAVKSGGWEKRDRRKEGGGTENVQCNRFSSRLSSLNWTNFILVRSLDVHH